MGKLSAVVVAMLLLAAQAAAQFPFSGSLIRQADTPVAPARQTGGGRILSGSVLTQHDELLPDVTVIVRSASGEARTISDAEGHFRLTVPPG